MVSVDIVGDAPDAGVAVYLVSNREGRRKAYRKHCESKRRRRVFVTDGRGVRLYIGYSVSCRGE
jgi:hypothetical protein